MQLTSIAMLAGALAAGVSAHPSPAPAHLKAHGQFHQRRVAAASPLEARGADDNKVIEFYAANRPTTTSTTTKVVTPTPTPTSTSTPAPATTSADSDYNIANVVAKVSSVAAKVSSAILPASTTSSSASTSTGTAKQFCSGSSKKRATSADISYVGNTGTATNWGCNIMEIECNTMSLYLYTMEVSSTGGTFSCSHFNKIGPEGKIDGFWYSALDFTINGGEKKCFAFDKNTQGGMACSAGTSVDRTTIGQLSGTWAEYDYGSDVNSDNSGSDVSVLVAQAAGRKFIGMSIANPSGTICSWVKSDGTNFQAYMSGMEDLDGVGCTGYYKGSLTVILGD
ncbi:hypothetical protein BROUX41_003295 [Berkeleyomyces rouxiae]|uniref:uncharacterized protein n=1 Tax=Berkeleyomyces rouxiae TaxID=2035830 RepID=UPI003B78EA02